ncbi:MAG: hypothetical protein DRN15_11430 [Thermoprotei archaeon]|nr:MAG: hypothetical protein DRN15_11430 [Thermoprotei archaeon]
MNLRKIDLEQPAKEMKWTEKHADYLLIVEDTIVIVEETSRAKINDIEKLESTIKAILQGPLKKRLRKHLTSTFKRIIAIIHAKRGIDSMIARCLMARTRRNRIFSSASCNQHLRALLNSYLA